MESYGGMILTGGKPVTVALSLPQIPNGVALVRTRAYAVRGRLLTS
jgi:hypothetical protein